MNKFIKITKNELTKQFKKKSIVIMLIMIMSIGIIFPVATKFLKNSNANSNTSTMMNSEGEGVTSGKTDKEKINNLVAQGYNKYNELYVEGNLEPNDWRAGTLQKLQGDYTTLLFLEAIQDGLSKEAVLKNGVNIDLDYLERGLVSEQELVKVIGELKKEVSIEEDIILNKNYIEFLKVEIKSKNEYLNRMEKEKNEISNSNDKEELKNLDKTIKDTEEQIQIYKYRLDNKIDFSKENWKNKTLLNIEEINEELNRGMLSEKEFRFESNMKMSYEDYVANYNRTKEKLENEKALDWYSLKNDIPQMQFKTDARTIVDFGYNIFVVLSIFVVILIGGGIVASEFSQGTIRLLAIRPIKRGKILLAKLTALLIIGFGIIFAGTLMLGITSGILYGFGSYGVDILEVTAKGITETSFIVFLLKNILISSGSLIFMAGLVFFLSTTIKNASVAVLVGTVTYLGAMPITIGLATLGAKWMAFTPIPYINESIINIVPFFKEIINVYAGIELNPMFGFTILTALGIGLTIVSYMVFSKKDIKN
ncbi:MAG: ABC transporter permease [Clostridium sp.]|uniref:ABC transporter permease n=1 Tax=Clostridium sp. TaxID=1506 RepID=UPI003F3CD9AA